MSEVKGYTPRHKAVVEKIVGCIVNCVIVDGVVVPHCDCVRHGGCLK
jgi:hypothetical protein